MCLLLGSLPVGVQAADPPKPSGQPKPSAKQEEDEYELQRLLVDTLDQVERNYVRKISRRKLVEAAIKGVLAELDPYSSYIGPEEIDLFRTVVESEFGGIGVQITVEQGQLRILSPLVGTPAYRAGLMAGDRILEIDGKSTENVTMDEAVRRLKGREKTQVTLTVIHPGRTDAEVVKVTRAAIHIETVLGDHRNADDAWDFMLDPQRRIAYVRIAGFSRDTAEELRKALTALRKEKIRGLIVDLRFNPGGLLNAAVEVADLFVSQGRIVSTAGRNSPERVWEAHKEGTFEGFPMAVLVNRYSASASEIVAACLQDHKRAAIVGERTWGKGSVQNVIPLEGFRGGGEGARQDHRSALKLTTAGYRRPNGKNIDRLPGAKDSDDWGVTPDKGLDLRLDDRDMLALVADRRHRDILMPKQPTLALATTPGAQAPAKPAAPKPDAPKPGAAKPDAPPPAPAAAKEPEPSAQTPANPAPQPTAFVDRQLQMALESLAGEPARAR
jgi:carboxyl-terminal processing protease